MMQNVKDKYLKALYSVFTAITAALDFAALALLTKLDLCPSSSCRHCRHREHHGGLDSQLVAVTPSLQEPGGS